MTWPGIQLCILNPRPCAFNTQILRGEAIYEFPFWIHHNKRNRTQLAALRKCARTKNEKRRSRNDTESYSEASHVSCLPSLLPQNISDSERFGNL